MYYVFNNYWNYTEEPLVKCIQKKPEDRTSRVNQIDLHQQRKTLKGQQNLMQMKSRHGRLTRRSQMMDPDDSDCDCLMTTGGKK
jgi:hypothetical protein